MTTNTTATAGLIGLFGDGAQLWNPPTQRLAAPDEVLQGKTVMLLFSAYWCPPCRRFTPKLKELYKALQAKAGPDGKQKIEVVYCSMDNSEAEYKVYCSDMPWWCLPFQSPIIQKLAGAYRAEGIPHLVVIDIDGSVLCEDGINEVTADPEGHNFPWRCPNKLIDILPDTYLSNDGSYLPTTELDNKFLMLYFSASWSPPCQQFTKKISQAYKELKNVRDDFEILFVSSDQDRRSFKQSFGEMPFCAMPFGDRDAKAKLHKFLRIQGVPSLFMYGPRPMVDGSDRPLINPFVRCIIENENYISEFPFRPKPYGDINKTLRPINGHKCVVVFHEAGDDHEQEEVQEMVRMASQKYDGKEPIHMYWALCNNGLSENLRSALRLGRPQDEPTVVLLDIPDCGAFYLRNSTGELTPDSMLDFLKSPGKRLQI